MCVWGLWDAVLEAVCGGGWWVVVVGGGGGKLFATGNPRLGLSPTSLKARLDALSCKQRIMEHQPPSHTALPHC
eukprot:12908834-Prorocentrum_lima.AAC.1